MRFDPHADERAHQAAIDGWRPLSTAPEPLVDGALEWGVRGRVQRLRHVGARFEVVAALTASPEYAVIERHYGDRRAARSNVPLMHHIDEGLQVLAARGASVRAQKAFCLHPLVQEDAALAAAYPRVADLTDDPAVLALALEYRHIANATLSTRAIDTATDIPLSPLAEVNEMLVADKLQNWKDFVLHHRATHARSAALDRYFALWHERLGVTAARARWFEALQITPTPVPLAPA